MSGSTSSGKIHTQKPPMLAFVSDDGDMETLKAFAKTHQFSDAYVIKGDIATATDLLKNHPVPEILLVEVKNAKDAPDQLDRLAEVCDPDTKVVIIGSINEYSFYCWLKEIGVFSYLLKPLTAATLEGMWEKAHESPAAAAKVEKEPGRIIGVIGTRGGSGSTTIALAMSGLLAEHAAKQKKSVVLVDLDPQDGSVSLQLDLEPSRGVRDALEKPDRIDGLFLDRVLIKVKDNFSILSAEESLQDNIRYHDHAGETLLKALREKFGYVILDLPRNINVFSRSCMKMCDTVFVVSEMTLPGLRDAMRYGDLFREGLRIKPPLFVANRVGMSPKHELAPADFEKGINGKLLTKIPFAPDVFMETGPELPALKHHGHAAIKGIMALINNIIPQSTPEGEPEEKEAKRFNLFKSKKQ